MPRRRKPKHLPKCPSHESRQEKACHRRRKPDERRPADRTRGLEFGIADHSTLTVSFIRLASESSRSQPSLRAAAPAAITANTANTFETIGHHSSMDDDHPNSSID
jgi:hypothetical protein